MAVRDMPNLTELILPTGGEGDQARLEMLRGVKTVKLLSLRGNSITSLAPLEGWQSLQKLDLCDTGSFTDSEVLETLPNLQVVHLRGSDMGREQWPDSIAKKQGLLDFRSSYGTYKKGVTVG